MNEIEQKALDQQKNLANHYMALSEVYLMRYQDLTKPVKEIMIAKGILVEMMSELVFYSVNNPKDDRYVKADTRINKLMEVINEFSGVADFNYQISLIHQSEIRKSLKQAEKIEELENRIEMLTSLLNAGQ